LTDIACAMEIAGELHENLSDRMDELIDPIRKDRDWLQITGSIIVRGRPVPDDFDGRVDEVDSRALQALPKLRAMVLEAFERHLRPSAQPTSKPLNRLSGQNVVLGRSLGMGLSGLGHRAGGVHELGSTPSQLETAQREIRLRAVPCDG
jgi:hypothetical protein